ncbi:hypothetical protein [Dapis sp. BLCC M229]|uniref:hypothetical protein n=1 Tax=Dapis sp. BLCC M229 TaxID=3400188 RepID=UPI003CFA35D5
MAEVYITIKDIFKYRVIPIVENFLPTENLFENLERDEMVEVIVETFMINASPEQFQEMNDEILSNKIRPILGGKYCLDYSGI